MVINMKTSKADYKYILKELPNGDKSSVWALECSPNSSQLPFINDTGCLYIEMKPGTSEETANKIRDLLNIHSSYITLIN